MTSNSTDARHVLFEGLVDYAGLFPPAALSMTDAVANYASYLGSDRRWALGKFVLPVVRLAEFELAARGAFGGVACDLALVAGKDFSADVRATDEFARRAAFFATVGAIEVKAATFAEIDAIARGVALLRSSLAGDFDAYVEVPVAEDPAPLIDFLAARGLRAKVRTGGVEAGAFPTTAQVARFISRCVVRGVTFKATAGLHHAIRGEYALTYDAASERGTMFGFLNVFLATLFARQGLGAVETRALLEEREASSIVFSAAGISWRGHSVSAEAVGRGRAESVTSFGSCSFAEPIADLSSLGLL